ncbi:OX-2 membrane glycoprotein-like isoform X2 [Oreochromis niloticus]|uniref:OX-2 membrane glycoprotein-like isoform X2 n=1 Tax=Oreochromis niloticus TaxID=8128 RepID=UPI000DF2B83F|nr:OX-2 membrane glycoprotein-like isoform X2 [Oreochromis niloticus]
MYGVKMSQFGTVNYVYYVIAVFTCGLFHKALTAVIQTQQTVLAAVGEDAEFSCQLLETKDVLQVTWQKSSNDVETNVATYNKYFGQKVNTDFTDKVEFKYTGLQNCSIVIRNVTEQDEGYYRCLFNTYPEGSFIGRTCLQVYELHEPVVDVRESNSTEEWVVSCSATGRPAPTVTLSVSQQHFNFSQYNTVSVSNTNATFTVSTTAVLSGSRNNSTQVGCAARVLSAPHREVMVMIPDDDDDDGLDKKSASNHRQLGFQSFCPLYCWWPVLLHSFFSGIEKDECSERGRQPQTRNLRAELDHFQSNEVTLSAEGKRLLRSIFLEYNGATILQCLFQYFVLFIYSLFFFDTRKMVLFIKSLVLVFC